MKNAFWCMILVAVMVWTGCKDKTPAPQDALTVTKDKICLTYQKTETCTEGGAGTWRLYLKDGKPVLEVLETAKVPDRDLAFSQFDRGVQVKGEQISLVCNQKTVRLKDGDREFADSTGLGHLLQRDAKGQLWVMKGKNPQTSPHTVEWGKTAAGGPLKDRIKFESGRPLQSWMYLMTIQYQYGDGAMHYVPNDTGTEVVIIDNFHVEGNCNAATPDECCPTGESSGEQLNITEWVDDYAAEGQTLLACFNVNAICTFTDGDKLIVLVCESLERYCLDYSVCDITITTSDEGICFSVPSDCSMENPFN